MTCYTGTLGLTFSRDQLTTKFPVALAPAKTLGIYDSSFTAMAWVYSDPSVSDAGTADYAIFGTKTFSKNKGLHLQVQTSAKRKSLRQYYY